MGRIGMPRVTVHLRDPHTGLWHTPAEYARLVAGVVCDGCGELLTDGHSAGCPKKGAA